jgi:hypothetical protein
MLKRETSTYVMTLLPRNSPLSLNSGIELKNSHRCFFLSKSLQRHYLWSRWHLSFEATDETASLNKLMCVQTGSGAHPASYPMGTGGPFPGGKPWTGPDADHSPPSTAEVKHEQELYLLSPQALSCLVSGRLLDLWHKVLFELSIVNTLIEKSWTQKSTNELKNINE